MPLREFTCGKHLCEKLLFGEADQLEEVPCPECGKTARRVEVSLTGYRYDHTVKGDA